MAKHFDAHEGAVGAADLLPLDGAVDFGHLLQRKLACEHHHVGKPGVIAQGGGVAHRQLCGDVDLHTPFAGI